MSWRERKRNERAQRALVARKELDETIRHGASVSELKKMRRRLERAGAVLEPIIEGLLRQGEAILFAGTSEVGKSMFMRLMGQAVAVGEDFLGWSVPQPRRVVYFAAEDDAVAMIEEVERDHIVESPNLVFVPRGDYHLKRKSGLRNMRSIVKKHKPDLVILDTVAAVSGEGTRERDVDAVFDGLAELREAASRPGMSFVLGRHTIKPLFKGDPTGEKMHRTILKNPERFKYEVAGSHQWAAKVRGTLGLVQLRDEDGSPERSRFLLLGTGNNFSMFNDKFLTRTPEPPFRYELTEPRQAFNSVLSQSLKKIFRVMCDAGSFTYSKMEKRGYNRKMVREVIKRSEPFGVIRKIGDAWEVAEPE